MCRGVAKTLLNRQLVRLRRKVVCGSGFVVAVKRHSVGFIGKLVNLLRAQNCMRDVLIAYRLSSHELSMPVSQFAKPFTQFAMPLRQFAMPFREFRGTLGSLVEGQLRHGVDRSPDTRHSNKPLSRQDDIGEDGGGVFQLHGGPLGSVASAHSVKFEARGRRVVLRICAQRGRSVGCLTTVNSLMFTIDQLCVMWT